MQRSLLFILIALLPACSTPEATQTTQTPTIELDRDSTYAFDNSRNALDWPGSYFGALPYSNADRIETILTLNEGGSYRLSATPISKTRSAFELSGRFDWFGGGAKIQLRDTPDDLPALFLVGEGQLVPLDRQGNAGNGPQATESTLIKADPQLFGRRWDLIDYSLEPAAMDSARSHDAELEFSPDGQLSGSGGCNRLVGRFRLGPDESLRFSGVATTRMACPNLKQEQEFLTVLDRVRHFRLAPGGSILNLFDANMEAVARFGSRTE